MADTAAAPRGKLRRRWLAFGSALVLALLGVAFLVWSISQHQDARDDLGEVRTQLATNPATSSKELQDLRDAQQAVATVHDQLAALDPGANGLADMDQQDLEAVRAGRQTPVYFGSAVNNFGIQLLLDGFLKDSVPPAPRRRAAGKSHVTSIKSSKASGGAP